MVLVKNIMKATYNILVQNALKRPPICFARGYRSSKYSQRIRLLNLVRVNRGTGIRILVFGEFGMRILIPTKCSTT